MFKAVRRRLTFANGAMVVALLFAMTGGAFAAKKYLITSTGQIKPSVLNALKGKAGPAGPVGAVGPAGAAGARGEQGSAGKEGGRGETGATGKEGVKGATGQTGPTGAMGTTGATGVTGVTGATGVTGEPWTPNNTLPSGASETGAWALGYVVPSGEPVKRTSVSFPIKLAEPAVAPTENIIGIEEGEGEAKEKKPFPAGCKGTVGNPSNVEKPVAQKGNFCIFVGFLSPTPGSLTLNDVLSPSGHTGEATGTVGAQLQFFTKEGLALASGTWAVTAK